MECWNCGGFVTGGLCGDCGLRTGSGETPWAAHPAQTASAGTPPEAEDQPWLTSAFKWSEPMAGTRPHVPDRPWVEPNTSPLTPGLARPLPSPPPVMPTSNSPSIPAPHGTKPPPSAASRSRPGPANDGSIIGNVQGTPTTRTRHERFWGTPAFAGLCVLTVLGVILLMLSRWQDLIIVFIDVFFWWIVLAIVILVLTKGRALPIIGSLSGLIISVVGKLVGLMVSAGGSAAKVRMSSPEESVRELVFRVQTADGTIESCVFPGDPEGDELAAGDLVRVRGRRHRQGHIEVKRLERLTSPSDLTPIELRRTFSAQYLAKKVGDILTKLASLGVLALWALFLLYVMS